MYVLFLKEMKFPRSTFLPGEIKPIAASSIAGDFFVLDREKGEQIAAISTYETEYGNNERYVICSSIRALRMFKDTMVSNVRK